MWTDFCKLIGIRLIMRLFNRVPDFAPLHPGTTDPTYRRWNVIPANPFFNVALREMLDGHELSQHGLGVVLIGWFAQDLGDRIVLRGTGSIFAARGDARVHVSSRAWLLTLQFGRY